MVLQSITKRFLNMFYIFLIMAVTGLEWALIPLVILLVVLFLAIKYPSLRVGFGAALTVLGILLFFIPIIGPILGGISLVFGIFLLGWGAATLSKRHHYLRICPGCGRDISSFPSDIKKCPYCGRELA
ncbi:MAG: hypothetical protein QXL22_04400 [Candidatus Nezhaarchaeales archaeon]